MAPGGGQRQRDSKQRRLVAIADAGVGTAAALLIGWRRLIWVAPRAVLRRQNERAGRGNGHHVPLSVVRDSGSCRQAERGMVWGARLL